MHREKIMKRCISCGAALSEKPLLAIRNMPAGAQDIPDRAHLKSERGITVKLCVCKGCGLVQLANKEVPYYRDVIRAGGYSTTMRDLRKSQYEEWIKLCDLKGKKILEAGCGQGEFLRILAEYPVQAYGIEHKKDLVKKAREAGLSVECDYPEKEDAVFKYAPFDGFTSFNFLEHQPDPCRYLRAIANNLTPDGVGLITVPDLKYILKENSFYEIIPDHLSYFTAETLSSLLDRCGFDVLKKETVNRDTVSVIVKRKPVPDVSGLLSRKETIEKEALDLLGQKKKAGKKMAIWGASHQGFTLCAVAGLKDSVTCIIDSAPFKQNKFAPASHIPILSPEKASEKNPDGILIVAPGYTDEIAGEIRKKFSPSVGIYVLKTDHITKYKRRVPHS